MEATYFKLELIELTKKRAQAVGIDYDDALRRCGISNKSGAVWDTAKREYRRCANDRGYDVNAQLGKMKTVNYEKICIGFMIDPATYRVNEPPRTPSQVRCLVDENGNDIYDCSESDDITKLLVAIKLQQDKTNELLHDIREISRGCATHDSQKSVEGKLDKIFSRCQEIESHTSHLPDLKKHAFNTQKAETSIDQRLSGINQIVASHKIVTEKIKMLTERYFSGK